MNIRIYEVVSFRVTWKNLQIIVHELLFYLEQLSSARERHELLFHLEQYFLRGRESLVYVCFNLFYTISNPAFVVFLFFSWCHHPLPT